jgi:predicted amidohydrolase YtcJ
MEIRAVTDRIDPRWPRPLALTGGIVHTCDTLGTVTSAVGIVDRHIRAVGDAAAVRAALGPDRTEIDLGGRAAVPGLIDAHNHMVATAGRSSPSMPGTSTRSRSSPMRSNESRSERGPGSGSAASG